MSVRVILTPEQRASILELGSQESGGEFNRIVVSELFTLGIVEIRPEDRRLVLTEAGLAAYQVLREGLGS